MGQTVCMLFVKMNDWLNLWVDKISKIVGTKTSSKLCKTKNMLNLFLISVYVR